MTFSSFSDCAKVVSIAKRSLVLRQQQPLVGEASTCEQPRNPAFPLHSNLQTTPAITVRQCLGATNAHVGVLFLLLLLLRFQKVLFLSDGDDIRSQNLLSPSPPLPQQLADYVRQRTNLLLWEWFIIGARPCCYLLGSVLVKETNRVEASAKMLIWTEISWRKFTKVDWKDWKRQSYHNMCLDSPVSLWG